MIIASNGLIAFAFLCLIVVFVTILIRSWSFLLQNLRALGINFTVFMVSCMLTRVAFLVGIFFPIIQIQSVIDIICGVTVLVTALSLPYHIYQIAHDPNTLYAFMKRYGATQDLLKKDLV
jgi:hypothetical protein